uniref:Putative LOV domain-containing protein n=1 Tax=Equisetum hyemale TaxID=3262 RepID=A0A126WZ55_EQUHY|nr:putative LOV domain-containing protein [Equisetum hyemale]
MAKDDRRLAESLLHPYDIALKEALQRHHFNYVVSDPHLPDHPIVYASEGFLEMCGYTAAEVLGRNCRFLQGPATDRRTILRIRDAIREEKSCQVTILNYTKGGQPFWNLFHMAPIFSKEDGRVLHFIGVQTPVIGSIAASFMDPNESSPFVAPNVAVETVKLSNDCQSLEVSGSKVWEEEDTCKIEDTDKQKSMKAVQSLLCELEESSKCKGAGVAATRCNTAVAFTDGARVLCSSLTLALTKIQQSYVLANPHLPDMPIVHASDMFLQLTGYSREEVVGRNCRFLQGPGTDALDVQHIRDCIKADKSCTIRILNYRKDGRPFWNFLHVAPVRNAVGKVAFYAGVQLDVTLVDEDECVENGMSPHMKQLGAVGALRVAVRSLQGSGLRRIGSTHQ